jgi:hypothetical protein
MGYLTDLLGFKERKRKAAVMEDLRGYSVDELQIMRICGKFGGVIPYKGDSNEDAMKYILQTMLYMERCLDEHTGDA